jgi:hypothetical protein
MLHQEIRGQVNIIAMEYFMSNTFRKYGYANKQHRPTYQSVNFTCL